ncbi:DNA mismatch repair protein MutS [Sulfoacidibacillus thermotolerans]|uniref:DNA mismatch repair protein MutS n=2 Tax=Sulfoacidibacillus thermotolerans TaxID=1765684 RepID=A0A2U3DAG6_SULT2|nr:DNA mismatch repair protein MutS [Sulfoacidibacillus thermotolerans]
MMEQYLTIKQTCEDALLFFRLGDFYELFLEDAICVSELLDLTLTGRGTGEQRMPMCGVPYHAADTYISRLVTLGYKVAICEQVEDPKEAKGLVRREIIRLITPGTAHDYLRQENYRPLIATFGVVHEEDWTGAIADALTGNIWTRTGDFESLCNWFDRMQVAEVIGDPHRYPNFVQPLREYAQRAGIVYSQLPRYEEEGPAVADETGAQILLRYLEYTSKRTLCHMKAPESMSDHRFMELSASTVRHLEVIRPVTEGRKGATLLEAIDYTSNAMGRRRLREMLEHPLQDIQLIVERQERIVALLADAVAHADVRAFLKQMHDLIRIISRLSFGQATPRDLWQLAESLRVVQLLREQLQRESLRASFATISKRMYECAGLIEQIETLLSEEVKTGNQEGQIIRPGADPEIDHLRDIVTQGRSYIMALEQSERIRTGIKSLKIGYNRVFGYYIEITSANLHLVPQDYERKQTLANGERYVTKELRERELAIAEAGEKLRQQEAVRIAELIDRAQKMLHLLQQTADAVADLDAIVGLATAAKENHYVRPIVDDSSELRIIGGRHPVVERHTRDGFIENDTQLSCDQHQIALITGPNMGGKSTYMRQVALIVLMAQIGSFVPANAAHIGIVDKLFTRIGASDDVSAGLSTFMVEMTETAEILRGATDRSLLVFDEIGRGTATYDGMSIAEAIVEYVHDHTRARSLFSTHYHELTELPARLPRVFNLSVAVKEHGDQIVFLHRVVNRPADRSYGIQVAQKAGLPTQVTVRAKQILGVLELSHKEANASLEQVAISFVDQTVDMSWREWIEEVADLPLEEWSPRQALHYLFELQERILKKGNEHGKNPRT